MGRFGVGGPEPTTMVHATCRLIPLRGEICVPWATEGGRDDHSSAPLRGGCPADEASLPFEVMRPKTVIMRRVAGDRTRPVMLAIAGDSAAGKTTLTGGLVEALGELGVTSICVDDYHRYDRAERQTLLFTPLHPACNYIRIMEQHLQLLATGEPILKPVYNHDGGTLERPVLLEPSQSVIIEGLLPLHSRMARACFDLSVYLDPPEEIRRAWKVKRDTRDRRYTEDQVLAELDKREPESAAFIRPQRRWADIVVRFAPIAERGDSERSLLSAMVLLRPTAPHPDLIGILAEETREAIHVKLVRDEDGKPVDALHIHAYATEGATRRVKEAIWASLRIDRDMPEHLGEVEPGVRSEPLAVVQLILLYHLLLARRAEQAELETSQATP
jgi:phosphoribulokinase